MEPPDSLMLSNLARVLAERLSPPPRHYIPGKTRIRDAIISAHGCSAERAEELTEVLEARGYIRFHGSPRRLELEPYAWAIEPHPSAT